MSQQEAQVIIFNVSKNESGNPSQNLKKILKKYKPQFKCGLNKEELTFDKLKQANLIIFFNSREQFNKDEFNALKKYLENGGNILYLGGEGGELKQKTNINFFLEQCGISVNNDTVVRTCFYKYFNPKECLVQTGVLNEEVGRVVNGYGKESKLKAKSNFLSNVIGRDDDDDDLGKDISQGGVEFVYVNGCTLTVQQPAIPFLSSGPLSYPTSKPVAAAYMKGKGKLIVGGSYEMFSDEYFEKENNQKIFDFFLKFLLTKDVDFEPQKDDPSLNKQNPIPDIAELSDKLKSCLQESEDLPKDYTTLYDCQLFKYDTDLIPEAVKLFDQLGVKHEMLTLIVPQFETPLLGLQPAVFPPIVKELPPPPLELFDLDDEFASEKVRLAQVTNKCSNDDLEYFVKEAGDILGISDKVKNRNNPKSVISYILEQLVQFKKLNQN